jgi:predicted permease
VESVLLACIAGALGFALARWAGQALVGFVPSGDIPINEHREWDWRLYAFAVGISVLTGVITGFWSARKATRFDLAESLKEGSGAAGAGRHTLRNLLVVGQVALSLVVLASAGLFVHSLRQLQNTQLGFRPDGLLLTSVDLGLQQYSDERGRIFLDELLRRSEALPGVTSATAAGRVPFDNAMQFTDVVVERDVPGSKDDSISIGINAVGPRFFETVGTAITRGRPFEASDDERGRRVAVVNETMARKLWPGQDPIGRRFRYGRHTFWTEVVGVAQDGKYMMLAEQPRPFVYVPLAQQYDSPVTIAIRCASDPAALATPLRKLINEMDPDLPVFNVRTMDTHLRESLFALMPLRAAAWMAGVQGLIALLLAVMGLYAVVSYAVARRTREIGVRIALGAQPADVLRLVVREGMWLTTVGSAIGLLMALGVGVVLSAALYGVTAMDGPVFAGATLLLLGVSALACYVPARRATRMDPLSALRCE